MNIRPHPINPAFEQHPDPLIQKIEQVAIKSMIFHTKKTEETIGTTLHFYFKFPSNDGEEHKQEFSPSEVFTTYFMLPIFIDKNINHIFNKRLSLFPQRLFVTQKDFSHPLEYSIVTLSNTKYFSILPFIIDYLIERFIHRETVRSAFPESFSDKEEYLLYSDKDLNGILTRFPKIEISLNGELKEHYNILQNNKHRIQNVFSSENREVFSYLEDI